MRRVAPALALIVGAAIALTATVAASPSYAAGSPRSLPAADTMFALSYGPDYSGPANLRSVDAATAVSTQVGTAPPPENYSYANQPAWDPITRTAFFVRYDTDSPSLATMNTSTGVLTAVANFTLAGERILVNAIAISPTGVAYANANGSLYSLNLTDATLTTVGPTASGMNGLAFNPAGVLYGMDRAGKLYTVSTVSGVPTLVTTFNLPANPPGNVGSTGQPTSIQFDSSGTLWIVTSIRISEGFGAELWSADLTAIDPSASAVRSGAFIDGETYYYHEALLIVPCAVPAFTSTAEAAGTVGSTFTFTATTSGGEVVSYAITAGTLPAGLVLDAATGIISGTPTGVRTSTFTITATNLCGTTKQPFTLVIAAVSVHLPVVSG